MTTLQLLIVFALVMAVLAIGAASILI